MEEENSQIILENAHTEFNKRDYKQAEELYTKFISSCLQSRDCKAGQLATAYNNRGQIKYLRVDFSEAVEDYTSAIQADSQFEIPFYNRGLIRYRLGPVDLETVRLIMECFCRISWSFISGFFDDAKSDFQQVLKLNPDFEDAKVSLQQTLLDQQQKINRGY